tara:strand:- start:310 stop:2514 length:2205 start_codon:yes stop_codon:yes gene_type:complete
MAYIIFLFFLTVSSVAHADPISLTIAAVAAGIGTTGTLALGTLALSFSIGNALVGVALAAATSLLAKKPGSGGDSFGPIRTNGSTQQFRQPVTAREIVYGEVRKSGPVVYAGVTDSNRYIHMVIVLATHEIEEIGEIIVNDLSIPVDDLDADGVVQSGRYKNVVRIKKHLGTADQLADSNMVSEIPEWSSSHRLRGCAYIYVRLTWNRDVFTSGVPNFSSWIKGKKCLDSRDATEKWTPNSALQSNEYLTNDYYGLKVSTVDQTELNGAANTCEEFVTTVNLDSVYNDLNGDILTLSGDRLEYQLGDRIQVASGSVGGLTGGVNYYVIPYQRKDVPRIKVAASLADAIAGTPITLTSFSSGLLRKNAEPRYFGGGILRMDASRGENLKGVLSGMSGQAVYAGGTWRILAGEYQTPTISFNEKDLAGGVEVSTKVSKKDRFNRAQGIYVSQLNDGNPSDYPLVKNSTYETQDGSPIKKDIDLSFTQRPHTAMRICKLQLERNRQEITFTADFKLTAFKVQVGDNIYLSFAKYGWSSKIFEVLTWTLSSEGAVPVIRLVLRENASAVYDWNSGEETLVDPAPNSSLPNPFDVDPPTGLSVTPIEINTLLGDFVYEFRVDFTPPNDLYVTNGGYYQTQYKESTNPDWENFVRAEDDQTSVRIKQINPGVNYDFRMRSVNYLGVRSQWQDLFGFNITSPSGATIRLDYKTIDGILTETKDYGPISEAVAATTDYGEIG